ncbi:Nitrogen permease regulator 3 [Malassezia caprae]|uniref:Nitrogen permease regulator 3 n=1 Tax=Malassezia caprae TaxID=1381934 RepID=A0AAF0IX56_9BASI|nr:Nitrogen permease regulator 3 [Malassezia caprae]
MEKENAVPATPHTGSKRSSFFMGPGMTPKRLLRTYRSEKDAPPIPFAPAEAPAASLDVNLLDHLESLSLDPRMKERIVGMHKQSVAEHKRSRRMPSILSFRHTSHKAPKRILPTQFLAHLRLPARQVSMDMARQLRVALASESLSWIQSFIDAGGYQALLSRLDDLLQMEWREEQHDDTLLHELLRCIYALSSSEKGIACIQASAPAPMEQLMALLYSDRTPAELDTRRLIIQLFILIAPLSLSPQVLEKRTMHRVPVEDVPCVATALASDVHTGAVLVAMLLHTPRPASYDAKVEFLQRPNEYQPLRKYIHLLQQVCGDFFWIFCHKENKVLDWHTLDAKSVSAPQVPSGITGSVEWDATMYLKTHLRFLSTILTSLQSSCPRAAQLLMQGLEEAGLKRVLEAISMASQVYYTSLHAELAHLCAIRMELRDTRETAAPSIDCRECPMSPPLLAILLATSSSRGTNIAFQWPRTVVRKKRRTHMRYYANPDQHSRLSSLHATPDLDYRSESEDSADDSEASSASSEASFLEEVSRLRLDEEERTTRDTKRFRDSARLGRSTSRARSGSSPDARASSGRSRSASRPPPRMTQSALMRESENHEDRSFKDYHTYLGLDLELLASILIPRESQCFQRFEVAIDDLIFLGHPVCQQHEADSRIKSQSTIFNIVMVFDRSNMFPDIPSVDCGTWLSLHYTILFKITAVFAAEEERSGLISEQSHALSQLREECMQNSVLYADYVRKALEMVSVACMLKDVFRLLARVRRSGFLSYGPLSMYVRLPPLLKNLRKAEKARDIQPTIDMHDPIVLRGDQPEPGDLSPMQRSMYLGQPTSESLLHSWSTLTGPLLRPWQTLILPEEAFTHTQGMTAYDTVRVLVPHFKPTMSGSRTFGQIAEILGWDLYKDLYPLVRYLIYYGEARVVDVPRIQSIYTVDPTFDMETLSALSDEWADAFPAMPPLPWLMDVLSSQLRPFASHCRRFSTNQRPLDLLAWLIRNGVVVQTHVHLRLVITVRDQVKAIELQRLRREKHRARNSGESESDSETLIDTLRGQIQQGIHEPERPVPDPGRHHQRSASTASSTSSNDEWMYARLPPESAPDHRPPHLQLYEDEDPDADPNEENLEDVLPNRALCPVLIPEPARANRTESEWIAAMLSDKHPWYTRWLIRLFPYLNGKHTVEEIVLREGLRRRDLKLILTEFDANLLHLYHP